MHKEFASLEELLNYARDDKQITGSEAITLNRYPIRFVLFDNFQDSFEFVQQIQSEFACTVKSVEDWLDIDANDSIITHSSLANLISSYIFAFGVQDAIITPFSELARFYNNTTSIEFYALISTIKSIESTKSGFDNRQRIYIPIVGLEGEMSYFFNDSQISIWHFKNPDKQLNYRLILVESTYGVKEISDKFTICNNIQDWLKVWKNKATKSNLISTSTSLYANAEYAEPDNAFDFCKCNNAYDFLIKGLNLNIEIEYKPNEDKYWNQLASEISYTNFSIEDFFNKYFHINELADYKLFLKTWFEYSGSFERWLLTNFYVTKFCDKGYICHTLKDCHTFSNIELFSNVLLSIFDMRDEADLNLAERFVCLEYANKNGIIITEETQILLEKKLSEIADKFGYLSAIRYFSPLTNIEKVLAFDWWRNNKITLSEISKFFPDLASYLSEIPLDSNVSWVADYFIAYKQAKSTNTYTYEIGNYIKDVNGNSSRFNSWYQQFKTTKTFLTNRNDIEIYFWIDGLGVEWISFIHDILKLYRNEQIFLNEVHIARALLPSTTEVNKSSLSELCIGLKKVGDLDEHAHSNKNSYPHYIIDEFEIVKSAIHEIISNYNGKKIAIVSDHGLTALSQICEGLNLVGVTSNHHGRFAVNKVNCTLSKDYFILDDKKIMCALNHYSLCGKVPIGQSAHGGCTPEEVLVPIFVISNRDNAVNWSATLISKEILLSSPIIEYNIVGLTSVSRPQVIYNGQTYNLNKKSASQYISESIVFDSLVTEVTLLVDGKQQADRIRIKAAAEENDLFDF